MIVTIPGRRQFERIQVEGYLLGGLREIGDLMKLI